MKKTFSSVGLLRGFEGFGVVARRESVMLERMRMGRAVEGVGEKRVRVHTVVGVERAGNKATM